MRDDPTHRVVLLFQKNKNTGLRRPVSGAQKLSVWVTGMRDGEKYDGEVIAKFTSGLLYC
jgi:hypothetical protein